MSGERRVGLKLVTHNADAIGEKYTNNLDAGAQCKLVGECVELEQGPILAVHQCGLKGGADRDGRRRDPTLQS